MRVVLDTNVLISAVVYGGNPREILQAAISKAIQMSVSDALVKELRDVLHRPQFGLNQEFIESTIAELISVAEWVVPQQHYELIEDDPSDNQVLDCAVAARADYLVTGDGHLLRLGDCGSVKIINPYDFVSLLQLE